MYTKYDNNEQQSKPSITSIVFIALLFGIIFVRQFIRHRNKGFWNASITIEDDLGYDSFASPSWTLDDLEKFDL